MGQITQSTFDSSLAATLALATEFIPLLGALPSPGESSYNQESANLYASGRDVCHKVEHLADHVTPGTIDQSTYDAEMAVLLASNAGLDSAANEIDSSPASTKALELTSNIRGLSQYMTTPPAGAGDPQRSAQTHRDYGKAPKMSKSDHDKFEEEMDKDNKSHLDQDKKGVLFGRKFKGFKK